MFSSSLLQNDLEELDTLRLQRENCQKLISQSMHDIIDDKLSLEDARVEHTVMQDLYDQFKDLNEQIQILEEQIYLNYTNLNTPPDLPPLKKPKFEHIDTILGIRT